MRFGSLFSGIEAASAAWLPLGWSCAWVSEIDPFACAVLKHHYPDTPNLGDMTKVAWNAVEPVDLVVGGPPCQDFSVAGQRAGHTGTRGNLSLAYVDAIDAIDPAWSLTENVPGWLSMGDNSFGHFLGRLVGADAALVPARGQRWTDSGVVAGPRRTAAWRILDAQYWGVPQRRRRVFVVAVRGAGNRACAEAIFPQQQSVPRNFAPRRTEGEKVAPSLTVGAHGSSGQQYRQKGNEDALVVVAFGGNNTAGPIEVATACNAHGGPAGRLDFETETFVAHALPADGFDASEDGTGRGTPPVAIAFDPTSRQPEWSINRPLKTDGPLAVAQGMSVRRLTPHECERLQGFPDDWTAIPWRGKPAADGPRYRAIGGSMAVPVVRWIGQRIQLIEAAQMEAWDAADRA